MTRDTRDEVIRTLESALARSRRAYAKDSYRPLLLEDGVEAALTLLRAPETPSESHVVVLAERSTDGTLRELPGVVAAPCCISGCQFPETQPCTLEDTCQCEKCAREMRF